MEINSGLDCSFWYDNWLGTPLRCLLSQHQKPMRSKITYSEALTQLHLLLPRPWDEQTSLLMEGHQPSSLHRSTTNDRVSWRWSSIGTFSVSSLYKSLSTAGKLTSPLTCIWRFFIPPSLKFFLYLLCHDKLLTQQQLRKRHLLAPQPLCFLCQQQILEDSLHLFFYCPYTLSVWRRITLLHALPYLLQSYTVQDSLVLTLQQRRTDKSFHVFLSTALWAMWVERNNRIFRGRSRDVQTVANGIEEEAKMYKRLC
ncbi:RNA-directed DNA polymerase (reverse transcriptase)-related family protein [Rhynchospora pubera]|uniref:RNA-directed DNA polymerase (Reverse transcriptase)-related family protein n=1 Tax=Rhynchospora pubera TaxID=906938 RepID=A0AAV8E947_9POAL|nr:RNA-directed DNA polymerase (reverse transcriptase)-related family protein [Rhynchospora pubera]